MDTTLNSMATKKKPEPSAEVVAAKELVRLAKEQGGAMTGSTTLREIQPSEPLRRDVWCLWVHQVDQGATAYLHSAVPHGCVELLCHVGVGAEIVGPQTRSRSTRLESGTTIIGVRFRPGAVQALLPLSAGELVNQTVRVEDVLGAWGMELNGRLAEQPSPFAAVMELERGLVARLDDDAIRDRMVEQAVVRLLRAGTTRTGSLAGELGISERQLRRRFHTSVGMSPKQLHRLMRFQSVLAQAQHDIATRCRPFRFDLAAFAAAAGYADQSHLSRDCVRLTGSPPNTFLKEMTGHCSAEHRHGAGFAPLFVVHPGGARSTMADFFNTARALPT